MSKMPGIWETAALGEVCLTIKKSDPVDLGLKTVRYLDIGCVDGSRHALVEVPEIAAKGAPSRCRQILKAGDTVFSTVRPYLEKIAFVDQSLDGEFASTGFSVLRPGPRVHPRYLYYFSTSPPMLDQVLPHQKGVSYPAVLDKEVKSTKIPVPPLSEQRRIVDLLEEHLSRLDSAGGYLAACATRLNVLVKSILLDLIPDESDYPAAWKRSTVDEAGHLSLGRQRHPDWHTGPIMKPYLRVANVFEDRIDTSDVMEMHWPDDAFDRFKLEPGDVLLNEGQSPHLLGRPAIYRGVPPNVAFTNSLIRFKAHDEVNPEFALLVFRRHMHAGRFARESRITTNIAHLSARRLKPIEFPIPPLSEQRSIVDAAREQFDSVARIETELKRSQTRSSGLRRSLLAAAFSGRLTGVAHGLSVAEEMVTA